MHPPATFLDGHRHRRVVMLGGITPPEKCRKSAIMADAAHAVITRDSRCCTGNFYIDEDVLREAGVADFERYAVKPGEPLHLFLGDPPAELLALGRADGSGAM